MYECEDKMVSHPSHYISETGLETIDVIEAFTFDLKGIEAVDTANVIKYICRWKQKNGLQDLKKAAWYLNHLIDHVEKLENENENKTDKEPDNKAQYKINATVTIEDYESDIHCKKMICNFSDIIEANKFDSITCVSKLSLLRSSYGALECVQRTYLVPNTELNELKEELHNVCINVVDISSEV